MKAVSFPLTLLVLTSIVTSGSFSDPESCPTSPKLSPVIMSSRTERTFIMVKPDGVQRGLVGEVIKRFEQKGYQLIGMKFLQPTTDLLKVHYQDLSAKSFFPALIQNMASSPVVAMAWEGLNIVRAGRVLLGETNPQDSAPGTIRGDFCVDIGRNLIHGSDSTDSANREIALWFKPEELVNWSKGNNGWIYE